MKKIYKSRLNAMIALTVFLAVACKPKFNGMNTDPNNPLSVPTSHLLTNAQRYAVQMIYGNSNTQGQGYQATQYIQHWAGTRGGGNDIYINVELDFSEYYYWPLTDLNEIIRLNSSEATSLDASLSGANINQIAVARILKVWIFQNLTDTWGDIPYSEALKGRSIALPKYDRQSDIYADMIKELDEANAQISTTGTALKGDIIYNGNMANWKTFSQSLKMRLGMRLSKVDPARAQKAVSEAHASGVFNSNGQNAKYTYLSAIANSNPYYFFFNFSAPTIAVTNTLIDKLKALEDPRLPVYADTAKVGGKGYNGTGFGLDIATANLDRDDEASWPRASTILQATTPFKIMTYAEVSFLQSEAALKGWIPGDAASYYNNGITASLQYWGVSNAAIATYLARPDVAFQPATALKSIGDQKWIDFYQQGNEAWFEWRRLGYPELKDAPLAFAGRKIPRRRGYPQTELTLNSKNYQEALDRQGPDELSTRVWWDVSN